MSFSEWKEVKFQELYAEPSRNGLTKPKKVRGQGIKFVNMGELFSYDRIGEQSMNLAPVTIKERENFLLKEGDLLFARQSLVREGAGKCSIILKHKEEMTYDSHLIRVRLNKNVADPKFYYYFFKAPQGKDAISTIVEQVAAAGIRGTDLARIKVPLPSYSEQEVIAATLSALDDMIELNNQTNKTLEEMAQAIFKSWFVDFELFKDGEFEESELGLIPKGWRVAALDEIATYLNGLAMQKYPPSKNERGLPVLKIKELRQGFTDGNSDICSESIDNSYIINDGDVIFSWSGSLLVDIWCGGRCGLNQHLFKVTSASYNKWFYYMWTRYHLERFIAIAKDKATTMGHIQRKHLSEAKVLIPESNTLAFMDSVMQPIIDLVIANKVENKTLSTIRDTLLPKLMSGEIRVPVEEVV